MLGPTLRGEKISLEPTNRNELDLYRQWFMDTEITRYLSMRFVPSEKGEEEWYDNIAADDSGIFWNIVAGGQTIGNTAIANISWIDRHAITGLVIGDRSEWGKGYASEAVKLRTKFAFGELGLERLESESFVENAPMHRALEKSGYQKIGRRRHYFYREGAWHDAYIFELLREEWQAAES